MRDGLLDAIRERGHWRVNFQPVSTDDALPTLSAALGAVSASTVRLRGWPYPFASNHEGLGENAIEYHDNYVEGWGDWDQFREFWRFFTSSQFINYRGVHEDWEELSGRNEGLVYDPSRRALRTLATIYQVTEFYAFLTRLIERGLYTSGVKVTISLHNSGPRVLVASESRQLPFMLDKVSHAGDLNFVSQVYTSSEAADTESNAARALSALFDRFGWNPPTGQIEGEVSRYLAGRS